MIHKRPIKTIYQITINFVFQKALIQTFHTSFLTILCEFTAQEHKFKRWFCNQTLVWFLVYKNKSDSDLVWRIQLISIKGQNSLHPQHEFLTFNNH